MMNENVEHEKNGAHITNPFNGVHHTIGKCLVGMLIEIAIFRVISQQLNMNGN